jgi:4-amino-4-deoxy-L-arabinose transferase-like glycosyltransferase
MQRVIGGLTPYLLLTLLCLAMFLPGLAVVPPIDRDESRFAQASHQMLESGDYVRIQFQHESRAKKPVGIYWMQAASAHLLHAEHSIWAYRLPSVLGGLLAVLLTFHFGQALFGRPAALMGAALLAASFILVSEAHQAKTDAMLLACIVAAQGVLGRFYMAGKGIGQRPNNGEILLFWLAMGVGILIKGPIMPLISLLTIAALWIADRKIGWLHGIRPIVGMIIAAAIVAPWVAAVSSATEGQFIGQAVKSDLLPKLLGSQESHGALPGYFLLLAIGTMWPASLFAVPGLVRAVKNRHAAGLRFCLAWIVPAWILFEIVPTKLPHYVMPTYPALALLAGIAIAADDLDFRSRWFKVFALLWTLVGVAVAVVVVIAPMRLGNGLTALSLPAAAAALTTGFLPAILALRGRLQAAVATAVVGAMLTYASIFTGVLPHLDRIWLSRTIAAALPPDTPVVLSGFTEPSLVFLLGTDTRLADGHSAALYLLNTPDAMAVVELGDEPPFLETIAEANRHVRLVTSTEGFNYSRGRPAHLNVWELEAKP